jgi:carboxymethylenebutenolidase
MHAGLSSHAQVKMHVYEGLDHAFARVGGEHYDAKGAALTNERTMAFFAETLS